MSNFGDYGTDVAGVGDVDATLTVVSGETALVQAIARRLSTRRGALWYDSDYGTDITELVGSTVPASVIASRVEAECVKDERIASASVSVTETTTGHGSSALDIAIRIVPIYGSTFTRTIRVTSETVTNLEETLESPEA